MKILFIINSLKSRSGSERVATQLANQLVALDSYSISIVTRDSERHNSAYKLADDIKLVKLSGNSFQFFLKLKKLITTNHFDAIVIHNMGKLTILCSLLSTQAKLISLEHGAFTSRQPVVRFLSKLLYKKINQVITLTKNDKQSFDKFHTNVTVIPNFSPYSITSQKKHESKNIIAVGRLTDEKNYIHSIKAWERIYKKVPDWRLDIYGDGEQKDLLHDYIKSNKILNIHIHDSTPNIADIYSKANFFLMSSKNEGLPMVLIESQSFGLPIISYDCPHGPRNIIENGVNGFLVENQNIEKLSEAMFILISNKKLQEKMSENSLINAKKYEPKEIINTWVNKVFKVEVD